MHHSLFFLTKRVRVISNDEIADLGNGINLFMDKLQEILKLIIENTNYMENVVAEVDGSVVKSNDSASDLSAMTEELSATMQDVGLSVNTINDNADNILKDVEIIATKSDDINQFSKEMKANAEKIESANRFVWLDILRISFVRLFTWSTLLLSSIALLRTSNIFPTFSPV